MIKWHLVIYEELLAPRLICVRRIMQVKLTYTLEEVCAMLDSRLSSKSSVKKLCMLIKDVMTMNTQNCQFEGIVKKVLVERVFSLIGFTITCYVTILYISDSM